MDIYGTGGRQLERRLGTPPGGQPRRRRKLSDYARQLEEKQKVKAIYGVRETQFRRYFERAGREPGPIGANLLRLLERRLDNVVYRLGIARSRPMARQLVSHGHVTIDGHRASIPSELVESGATVALALDAAKLPIIADSLAEGRQPPEWLTRQDASGKVLRLPSRTDVKEPIDEGLIVAFYAR
jgi:small subunit ribosomal protein S4